MDLAIRMERLHQLIEGRFARVDGDIARFLGIENKDIVDVGFGSAEGEGLVAAFEGGEGCWACGGRDAVAVEGEVGVCY